MGRTAWRTRARRISGSGRGGFSLIEMMVALFILAFSILGLLSLTVTSVRVNHQNEVRNLSIRMASLVAGALMAQPFDNVTAGSLNPYDATNAALQPDYQIFPNPTQMIRGGVVNFAVNWQVNPLTNDLREIQITVQYNYRNQTFTHNTVVYRHRAA